MTGKSLLPYILAGATGAMMASFAPLLLTSTQAETKLLPFQGRLTDAAGTAIADGAKVVEFKMYDAPTGGNVKWAGEIHKLSINGGLVNTMLGGKSSLGTVNFSTPCYLQITVDANADNQITAADPPLLPRQSVIPAAYASVANQLQYVIPANGGTPTTVSSRGWEAVFDNGNPETGRIPGVKLTNGSVGREQIAAGAVGPVQLQPHRSSQASIETTPIASRSVIGTLPLEIPNFTASLSGMVGRPVEVRLMNSYVSIDNATTLPAAGFVFLKRNGARIAGFRLHLQTTGSKTMFYPSGSFSAIDFPPAGDVVYSVEIVGENASTRIIIDNAMQLLVLER